MKTAIIGTPRLKPSIGKISVFLKDKTAAEEAFKKLVPIVGENKVIKFEPEIEHKISSALDSVALNSDFESVPVPVQTGKIIVGIRKKASSFSERIKLFFNPTYSEAIAEENNVESLTKAGMKAFNALS